MASFDKKHPGRNVVYTVSTLATKNCLIGRCIEGNDEWGEIFKARLEHGIYLVYTMARVKKFILKKKIISETPERPEDMTIANGFNKLCLWLDNESEPTAFLITELHSFW